MERLPKPTCTAPRNACMVVATLGKAKYREKCLQPVQPQLHLGGMETQGQPPAPSSSLPPGRSRLQQGRGSLWAAGTALRSPKPVTCICWEEARPPSKEPTGTPLAITAPEYKQTWPLGLKGRERLVLSSGFLNVGEITPKQEIHRSPHSHRRLSTR